MSPGPEHREVEDRLYETDGGCFLDFAGRNLRPWYDKVKRSITVTLACIAFLLSLFLLPIATFLPTAFSACPHVLSVSHTMNALQTAVSCRAAPFPRLSLAHVGVCLSSWRPSGLSIAFSRVSYPPPPPTPPGHAQTS